MITETLMTRKSSWKLVVEYDGSRYNGFQRQTRNAERPSKRPRYDQDGRKKGVACTIQDCLEEAFLLWQPHTTLDSLRLRFSGRTDKGVHARGQVVVVDVELSDGTDEEQWAMVKALNTRLPHDIAVKSMEPCSPTLEPRKACSRKQYSYTIRFRTLVLDKHGQPLPICNKGGPHSIRTAHDAPCLWLCPWALDDVVIQSLCHRLTGKHDFSAFIHKTDRHKQDNVKDLISFDFQHLQKTQEPVPTITARFLLEAKGFGRSMVRNLVGFVVDVSRGSIDIHEVEQMWTDSKSDLVHSAPACGLCLENVWF